MSSAVAAGIAYIANGKVLLVLRAADSVNGSTWGLPGGKVEAGETYEEAAIRESLEEIGYAPDTPIEFLNDDGHFVTFKNSCNYFTPVLNPEHTSHQWADPENFPEPMHPGLTQILKGLEIVAESKRIPDGNGWYEVKDNPISKVGVFDYSGRSIPGADPNKIYKVYRPAEELSNPETIESFKLVPFVDEHPNMVLGSENRDLPNVDGKPADGVIGEQVYFKDGYLFGNLKLFTDRINNLIDAGKKEVSAGFRCMYERASGIYDGIAYDYVQRHIRGNHVALVKEGRMGPEVAVLDHLTMTFDAKELVKMADEDKKTAPAADADNPEGGKKEMTLSEVTAVLADIVPAIAKLNEAIASVTKPAAPAVDEDEPEVAEVTAEAMDALQKEVKRLSAENVALKEGQASALDTKDVFKAVAKRDELYSKVSAVVGAFDHKDMTAEDIAKYGCEKFGLKVGAGQELVAVEAYLAAKPSKASGVAFDAAKTGEPSAIRKHVAAV